MQDLSHISQEQRSPVWFNDGLIPFEEASIHVITHSLNYGTAVFEGIRVYDTQWGISLFHLDAHLDRLMASASKVGIESRWSKDELVRACVETVRASGHSSGYLRPQIQFGAATPGLGSTSVTELTIFFWPLGAYRDVETLDVVTSPYQRLSPQAGDIEAKVVGYYTNSHLNYSHAHAHGADDAIMLDINGNVAEASSSNVFLVSGGKLLTPRTGFILKGITRASIIELARAELGLDTEEATLTTAELRAGNELFLTGTAAQVDPVALFDGVKVGDGGVGPVTAQLKSLYADVTAGKLEAYRSWHSIVA